MAGTSFFHVESQAWARICVTTPRFEKKNAWSAARLEKSSFRRPWQGPHFPVLCPRLGPKYSTPRPFQKKSTLAKKMARHVNFFQPMTRTSLCSIVSQVCAETFVTTAISEKTIAGAGTRLTHYGPGPGHTFPGWWPKPVEI